jgi:hypothetical protein
MPSITAHLDENEFRTYLNFKEREPYINISLLLRKLLMDYMTGKYPELNKEELKLKKEPTLEECKWFLAEQMIKNGKGLGHTTVATILAKGFNITQKVAEDRWKSISTSPNTFGFNMSAGYLVSTPKLIEEYKKHMEG